MGTVFGPPSEPINVAAFLQSALAAESVSSTGVLAELPEEQLCNVLAECRYVRFISSPLSSHFASVNDIQISLFDVWNNPRLSAHLLKEHELAINSIHVRKRSSKKRKPYMTDAAELPQEVVDLQKELNMVILDSWKLACFT